MSNAMILDKRPKVRLPGDGYLLSNCATEFGKILATKDIFRRAGIACGLNERGDGLMPMSPEMLRTWVEDYLVCYRETKAGDNQTTVQIKRTISHNDAAGILASPQFISQLQEIERFNPVRMPAKNRDGYIKLLPEGYDEYTKSFTSDSAPVVSGMDVEQAKQIIDEVLSEFGFADGGRSKAVAVAMMLSVYGAGLLPRKSVRPCFFVVANAPGAGKTLLVQVATVPVLGYAPTSTRPKDEDEFRKVLLTAVAEARPVICLDNLKGYMASEALEGFLTAPDYEGRLLGQTKNFRGENNATVFITGNGCTVSPDMRRRSLFCELFLECERAEDRVFHRTLGVPTLLEQRTDILSALWALIQNWDRPGTEPPPSRSNSSFPEWSRIIGGIVEHAGYGCPLETPTIAVDTDSEDMRALVTAIADGALLKAVTFDDLIETARANGLFERFIPESGDVDSKGKSSLGKMFKLCDRRLFGGYRFSVTGRGHSRKFQVEVVNR